MKRLLKQMARRLWRMSAPVRRPLIRKFDHHMMQLRILFLGVDVPSDVELALSNFVTSTPGSKYSRQYQSGSEQCLTRSGQAPGSPADLDLALNSVVRELGRLQMQVEALQQQIDDLAVERPGRGPRREPAVGRRRDRLSGSRSSP